MDINNRIKDYLSNNEISQTELSSKLGISSTSLSRSLNSDDLKVSLLIKICGALKVSASTFFDGSEKYNNEEIEGYKKRIKELETTAAMGRFYKFEKFFTEAKNMLEYGYPNLSPKIKEKVLAELFDNTNNYRQFVDDILANMMLDVSSITKNEIRDGIDGLVKKYSNSEDKK